MSRRAHPDSPGNRGAASQPNQFSLRLTSQGRLVWSADDDAPSLDRATANRLGGAFAQGSGQGLLQLGAGEVGQALPPVIAWWHAFAARFVTWQPHFRGSVHGWTTSRSCCFVCAPSTRPA